MTTIRPATVHDVDPSTPELAIGVERSHRGRGIGRMLLDGYHTILVEAGFAAVSLGVDVANPALHLYVRHGYEIIEEDKDSNRMIKRLR